MNVIMRNNQINEQTFIPSSLFSPFFSLCHALFPAPLSFYLSCFSFATDIREQQEDVGGKEKEGRAIVKLIKRPRK